MHEIPIPRNEISDTLTVSTQYKRNETQGGVHGTGLKMVGEHGPDAPQETMRKIKQAMETDGVNPHCARSGGRWG